ncbi:MAG: nicotinate-nucleotide adenylyltransferase [Rhodocyclaceae bacterium]|nr:nicotinate-nucleotide adenylyltransferase [Rhodocyclaceae bacterium]MDP3031926.1 nicotinate-nucleotide adenylyltransferase [Rhodocyclaceae bacterium]
MAGINPDPLGILGGTFDPVHNAHLALAQAALDRLGIAQVLWIPAGQPPHRAAPRVAPADRLAMVQAAIAAEPRFLLDASEVASQAPSFTVHTLQRLRRQYGPIRPLVLLMGADAFLGLPLWYRWQELFGLAHLAVATRPGFPLVNLPPPLAAAMTDRHCLDPEGVAVAPSGRILTFELIAGTVSATEVRGLLAASAPDTALSTLLPPAVLDYIHQHSLYHH